MTQDKIKLIWDFRGMDAEGTAIHHQKHLDEFAQRELLLIYETGVAQLTDSHFIAYITVEKDKMITVRDALIPHRGELA